jgi:superfamily II DNA helicase RecQ
VASLDKALIQDGSNSYWSFCVGYEDGGDKAPQTRPGRIDYKEVLDEADFALFARLRSLRKTLAERDGLPAYAVFTNEQLAEMVTKRVASLTDLQAIDGVGEAKSKRYGEVFLAELEKGLAQVGGNAADAPDPG